MENIANNEVVLFGRTNFRNRQVAFGIKMDDRRRHMYIIGKTGMGKSELLKTIAIQDIRAGRGVAFVDPHGDPVEDLLDHIPEERIKDVVYVNPADLGHPVAFNVMEQVDPDKRHLVADGVINVFKKIWVDVWSPRMEYILNHAILALLEVPDSTLLGINRMLAEKDFRNQVVSQLTDPVVKSFWTQEFARYADRFATEATAAIQNKVGQFTSSTLIRNIIGQPKSTLDMRRIMDEGKILLVNISKGRIGEDASRLLGALIITKLQLAAMSRVDVPESQRRDFILIVDEFQNFATASFAGILSEARKYHLSLIIAHQYVTQMDESVRDAVFGNVGTIISFRVGAEDAELLEKELAPEFMATDIVNLGKRQVYLKLMIDGIASRAFSALTMDTPARLAVSNRVRIVNYSRERYAADAEEIEKKIAAWHEPMISPSSSKASPSAEIAPAEFSRPFARKSDFGARDAVRQRSQWPATSAPGRHSQRSSQPSFAADIASRSLGASGEGAESEELGLQGRVSKTSATSAPGRPVDFRGRRVQAQPREPRAKPEIDVKGLREVLEEAVGKTEE